MEKARNIALLVAVVSAVVAFAVLFAPHHIELGSPSSGDDATSTVPPQIAGSAVQASPAVPIARPVPTRVVVYVCGLVKHPGVYEMAPGSRVGESIDRAGGALADADLEQLNLAEPLADAMKVDVPRKGEHPAFETAFDASPGSVPVGGTPHRGHRSGRSSHKLQAGQTLDVNTASETELTQLPGVGPSLAGRIVEYRTANGPFQSIDDLQNVSGIGPSKLDKMAPYVRL